MASGLAEDGWIPVDPATFATKFPSVFAVGDVTSAPVPRAGGIAEGEAATVAKVLISQLTDGSSRPRTTGRRRVTWSWVMTSWGASTSISSPTTHRSQSSAHPLLPSTRRSESGGPREPPGGSDTRTTRQPHEATQADYRAPKRLRLPAMRSSGGGPAPS